MNSIPKAQKNLQVSEQIRMSLRLGGALWSMDALAWHEADVDCSGHIPLRQGAMQKKKPTAKETQVPERVYAKYVEANAEAWFRQLKKEKIVPNEEQLAYLLDIKERCAQEAFELNLAATGKGKGITSEPYRKGLLGPPGTGKSQCLIWTSRFFEEVLGWQHGVQFQKIAPQHTMALLIGGQTAHSWGAVPINVAMLQNARGKKATQEVDELFERIQSMRWLFSPISPLGSWVRLSEASSFPPPEMLPGRQRCSKTPRRQHRWFMYLELLGFTVKFVRLLLDEIEALAAGVYGILDGNCSKALSRSAYARRPNGSTRPFGGLNMGLSGDWWQLPPVRQIGLYSNPFKSEMEYAEQLALSYFWRVTEDSVQGTHELRQPNRTKDPWLQEVLRQEREGRESWEVYCFNHGLPTKNVGSWLPSGESTPTASSSGAMPVSARQGSKGAEVKPVCGPMNPSCGNPRCAELAEEWSELRQAKFTWAARSRMECQICKDERRRRCRIVSPGGWNDGAHMREPFAHAPYIHPWNAPKYQAQQLRAISFAKATNQRLLWVLARDWAIPTANEKVTEARLQTLRMQFLQLHDKKTAGIMGLLPLVRNLPVRLTQTEDARVGAVKNARGTLIGWSLPEGEAARVAASPDVELVLQHRPEQLLIKLKAPLPGLPDTYGEGGPCGLCPSCLPVPLLLSTLRRQTANPSTRTPLPPAPVVHNTEDHAREPGIETKHRCLGVAVSVCPECFRGGNSSPHPLRAILLTRRGGYGRALATPHTHTTHTRKTKSIPQHPSATTHGERHRRSDNSGRTRECC